MSDAAGEVARKVTEWRVVIEAYTEGKSQTSFDLFDEAITTHTEAALVDYLHNAEVVINDLTARLAAAEGELAKYEKCVEEIQADQLAVAERENELHDEKDRTIATLKAALAQAQPPPIKECAREMFCSDDGSIHDAACPLRRPQ